MRTDAGIAGRPGAARRCRTAGVDRAVRRRHRSRQAQRLHRPRHRGRSAVVDRLVDDADVIVQGYRPGALDRFGLAPARLAERRPGIVVVQVSCYGSTGPWAERRGWEQLAQATTGMSWVEGAVGAGGAPKLVPAAATDYTTGYLAAAGVLAALRHRTEAGGSWLVRARCARRRSGSRRPASSTIRRSPVSATSMPASWRPTRRGAGSGTAAGARAVGDAVSLGPPARTPRHQPRGVVVTPSTPAGRPASTCVSRRAPATRPAIGACRVR
ncbi:MAG: CoA transferase [Acidimicrobiales bacterium]